MACTALDRQFEIRKRIELAARTKRAKRAAKSYKLDVDSDSEESDEDEFYTDSDVSD